jgi:hypothetical protein
MQADLKMGKQKFNVFRANCVEKKPQLKIRVN